MTHYRTGVERFGHIPSQPLGAPIRRDPSWDWTAACSGSSSPWHYEIRTPFAEAGIRPGTAHTLRLAVQHGMSDVFPCSQTVSSNGTLDDSSKWLTMHSSSNWQ